MSDSNTKSNCFSTQEDKIIKSTLILCDNNERKLSIIEKLKSYIEKMESLSCDDVAKVRIINDLKFVISSIKKLYDVSKHYLKEVYPSTNQTEEAYKQIYRRIKDASTDVARILFGMQNNNKEKSTNVRLTILSFTTAGDNLIEHHIDVPHPKDDVCKQKDL